MSFTGFDPAAVALLAELPSFDQTHFNAARAQLGAGLRQPGLALIEEVARATDPALVTNARSSASPLHRDLRFAKVGTPKYKDHLLLCAWQGADKKTAPALWLRIAANGVGFASGMAFDPPVGARWQAAVGGDAGKALDAHLKALQDRYPESELDIAGKSLAKVPKPWEVDHPRSDLLRLTGFQVRFQRPLPGVIDKAEFVGWCAQVWKVLLPIHRWLFQHLSDEGVEL